MRAVFWVAMLGLAGCVGPTGPVVGDWRGAEQSIEGYRERVTELILDGTPNDNGGIYHLVSSVPASGIASDSRDIRWSDRWQKRIFRDPSGAPYTVYHLDHAPPSHLADYALLSTGALLPVVDPAHPDLRPQSLQIALQPLPRGTYGYGRP